MLPVAYMVIMRRNRVQSAYDTYTPVPVSPPAIEMTVPDLRNTAITRRQLIPHQLPSVPQAIHTCSSTSAAEQCNSVSRYHPLQYTRT